MTYFDIACAYADSWSHFPIQRMPNISLQPGKEKRSLEDMISDTEDGILIIGDGSFSIDMQRYNFQFTGQEFWEIKNGKKTTMVNDVAYQGNTVDFWNSCDSICDESEYYLGGSLFCGKGEPGQISPVSHGAVPDHRVQRKTAPADRGGVQPLSHRRRGRCGRCRFLRMPRRWNR